MEQPLSKVEIDFYRLLVRCEAIVLEDAHFSKSWRFKAYLSTLRSQFSELKKKPASALNLRECGHRLDDLQSFFTEKQADDKLNGIAKIPGKLMSTAITDNETRENDMKQKHMVEQELRQRLLQTNSQQSNPSSDQLTKEEVEKIVQQQRKIQERQVEQLVSLVRDLKESANDANKIVRDDNKTLSQANVVAAQNMDSLSKQKKRLEDAVSRSSTLWQWFLIGCVIAAFVGMIVFMKIFQKRIQ